MSNINIKTKNGEEFNAYIALPPNLKENETAPSVVVIQEIFGVNKGIREKCDWLASEGFIACAPDLFWRIEPGIELSDHNEKELKRAFELFGEFDIEAGIQDIAITIETLTNSPQSNGNTGVMGYCLGGKLVYLAACHIQTKASVGYYGVGIEALLADANNMEYPLMLHIAEDDGFVPPTAQQSIKEDLATNDCVTLHSYPNVDHAFTRVGGDNYNEAAAQIADERTISFLRQNLA